ncbi:hypothetical protein [Aureimonas sp. AU22]|uniref:hypothetical protein n=1 Tax=Aureimonas sp. AU22 TaxID=1638162 RepID=UPI0007814CAB|nr:hypothetical protein [Aureimonas sp. AU22]
MSNTKAEGGVSLTTGLQTVVVNAEADAKVRTYEIRFSNIDGAASVDLTQCLLIDKSASSASRPILPVNATVKARDALMTRITLDPGDSVQASASAAGDLYALATKIFEEAA